MLYSILSEAHVKLTMAETLGTLLNVIREKKQASFSKYEVEQLAMQWLRLTSEKIGKQRGGKTWKTSLRTW